MKFYEDYLHKLQVKTYRINQVDNAIYREHLNSFEEITVLPAELRTQMQQDLEFPLNQSKIHVSKDGTQKIIFKTKDNEFIESVLMRHNNNRNTVCISSQIGCAVGCTFCSTGKLGFKRNLSSDEIVYQVLYFVRKLMKEEKQKVTNIVFMGMGEPFLNYDNVMEAIKTINHPKKLAFGSRHITISTSGIIPQIKKFTDEKMQVNLAISLHAASESLRSKIMPINNTFTLKALIETLEKYVKKTGRRIFYEYVMLKGVNDIESEAHNLGKLLQNTLCHVNLIPFNKGDNISYEPSSLSSVKNFQNILYSYGVPSTVRVKLGDDINGACGQLVAAI